MVFESSCYIVEAEQLTWADVRARCVELGGHLAIIESQAENQVVANLIQGKRQQIYLTLLWVISVYLIIAN